MMDHGTTTLTDEQRQQRDAEVKRAIDEVTSGRSPMEAQRGLAWDRMAVPPAGGGASASCRLCGQKTARQLNNNVCRDCFVSGVAADAARANPAPDPPVGDTVAPACGFCGRIKLAPGTPDGDPTRYLSDAEGMVRGAGGAFICQSCAFAVAGCAGAKDAQQARRLMAVTKLQAEAAARTEGLMELVTTMAADFDPKTATAETAEAIESLANAARSMAYIAFGDAL